MLMIEGTTILNDAFIEDDIGDDGYHILKSISHLNKASHPYVCTYLLLILSLFFYIML